MDFSGIAFANFYTEVLWQNIYGFWYFSSLLDSCCCIFKNLLAADLLVMMAGLLWYR